MFPLRVGGEAFFSKVCEMAGEHQASLVVATKGCGDLEADARSQLKSTLALSKRHRTLKGALAESEALNTVLWDAEQYATSLLHAGTMTSRTERINCIRFVERCRAFRRSELGKNHLEVFQERAKCVDALEQLARTGTSTFLSTQSSEEGKQ